MALDAKLVAGVRKNYMSFYTSEYKSDHVTKNSQSDGFSQSNGPFPL
jgi:hypothetical protein